MELSKNWAESPMDAAFISGRACWGGIFGDKAVSESLMVLDKLIISPYWFY